MYKSKNRNKKSLKNKPLGLSTKLGVVAFFNDASSEAIARTLPIFLTAGLGSSSVIVGIIEGVAETASIFIRGFSGWISDFLPSRKPLLVSGYYFSFLAKVTLLFSTHPLFLGLSRVFDRSGKGLRAAPRDAMIADAAVLKKSGNDFGINRFLDTLGAVTGLVVVVLMGINPAQINLNDFHQIILLGLGFGLIACLLVTFWVPANRRVTPAKIYLSLDFPKEIKTYLMIIFIFVIASSSDAFLVLRAKDLGFAFQEILILFIFFNIMAAALAIPIGRYSDRHGRLRYLAAGWFLYGCIYLGIGLTHTNWIFAVLLIIYGCFYGFTEGVEKALLADLLPAKLRGVGYGALQLTIGLATLPANILMGWMILKYGMPTAFVATSMIAFTAFLLLSVWGLKKISQKNFE
jgi:MFS family permease